MKTFVSTTLAALLLTGPAISFAQQGNAPLTRAQVHAELAQLRQAGYNPADHVHYPANIQAAQKRVQEQQLAQDSMAATPSVLDSSMGTSTNGSSESGRATLVNSRNSLYRGR